MKQRRDEGHGPARVYHGVDESLSPLDHWTFCYSIGPLKQKEGWRCPHGRIWFGPMSDCFFATQQTFSSSTRWEARIDAG